MTASVRLEGVSVARDGRTIWTDGTFSIPRGANVGVIGPNGAGKTTLLELLLGMLPPSTGRVEVLGATPKRGNPRIGYVPQNYTATIGNAVRCRDLVELGLTGTRWGFHRRSPESAHRVDAALASVSASDIAERRMSEVSGGQQQRVAIAQGLVHEPELLLLDEPLANLDLRNQHGIAQLLGQLTSSADITVLTVAHDLNPLLSTLTAAIYLLDGHAHYDEIGTVVNEELLSHLYGTAIKVIRTPQGDLFTRSG